MGSSVCAEMQHKFHHSHQLYNYPNKKTLREIDIPPRKLIGRRSAAEFLSESPNSETAIFRRFLPYNDDDDDDDDDPYSADEFRMFEFKVRKCNRSRSHDWTDCPFAHPGEKARRRDPRKYNYNGTVCPEFRKGYCRKGDLCEFAHGVFECWLHPSRYRTEACKDGKNCKRKVCFFVHSARQLRLPPDEKINNNHNHLHCCVHCHNTINANSPTSTLLGMSHLSPPVSPDFNSGRLSYKDAVNELMSSLEAMNIMKDSSSPMSNSISNSIQNVNNFPWIDVNFSMDDQTTQFNLSPSTPSPSTKFAVNNGDFPARNLMMMEEIKYNNEGGLAGPDLEWVNALLT